MKLTNDCRSTGRSPLTTHHSSLTLRAGFTLVELLVVIAIIAILFSLTSAAVIKVIGVADETANRVDIGHLEVSVEAFKNHYGVKYIPSRIWLDETLQYSTASAPPGATPQLAQDSKTYLKQVWPNMRFPGESGYVPGSTIDWDGSNNRPGLPPANVVLEGHQCLVFFLGGIPSGGTPGTTGFSTNKRNPAWHANPANSQEVVQPFYEFKSNRLVNMTNAHRFYSYLDTYGRADGNGGRIRGAPYAYFTSYKSGNDYNRYPSSDNASLGVAAYHEPISATGATQIRFHNATGFQIISAGLDGQFGPGGPWAPSTATGIRQDGRDDQANFYDRKLGVSQ